jgi:hypothetical protein
MPTDQRDTRSHWSDRSGCDGSAAFAPVERAGEPEIRASYGPAPGGELPVVVYHSVLAAHAWVVIIGWWAFGRSGGVDLDLTVTAVLGMVLFSVPVILFRSAAAHSQLPKLPTAHAALGAPPVIPLRSRHRYDLPSPRIGVSHQAASSRTRIAARMFVLLGMVAISIALPLRSAANAGPADDCNQVRNPDRQVRGCSSFIKSAAGGPESLAIAHLNRANVHARRGKSELAFADYAAALQFDPKNPLILYNRGNAYFDIKRYDQAIADYTRAIALDQKFALAYYNRGLAEELLGDNAAAADDYRRVLTIEPTAETARQRLGRLQSH